MKSSIERRLGRAGQGALRVVHDLGDEIVRLRLDDPRADEDPGRANASLHVRDSVDLVGLPVESSLPSDIPVRALARRDARIDEDLHLAAEPGGQAFLGDVHLDIEQLLLPGERDARGNLAGERARLRSGLGRIGENADVIEGDVLEKAGELPEVSFRLSGKAGHHRRPQHEIVDRRAQKVEKRIEVLSRISASHSLENRARDVLNRDIEIRADRPPLDERNEPSDVDVRRDGGT